MDEQGIAALVMLAVESYGDDAARVLEERIADLKRRGDDKWASIWAKVYERIVGGEA